LAVTKSDLMDEEMQELLRPSLPEGVEAIFISAVTEYRLTELKDKLWALLTQC